MMPEANGEISNEFFKKLNQQIVQKDNLIKLLQLQIRNLKNQIEAGEADAEKSDDLQRVLEQKNSELEGLRGELEEQKKLCASIGAEKDEQIRSLNEMLEQSKNMTVAEYAEDPKITELEENIRKIQSDPHNTVFGCIIDIMKGNGNLCHTEARCKMTRVHCYLFHNILS